MAEYVNSKTIEEQRGGYQAQLEQLQAGLTKIEADFVAQKEYVTSAINQVAGAIQALDVLKASYEKLDVDLLLTQEAAPEPPVALSAGLVPTGVF